MSSKGSRRRQATQLSVDVRSTTSVDLTSNVVEDSGSSAQSSPSLDVPATNAEKSNSSGSSWLSIAKSTQPQQPQPQQQQQPLQQPNSINTSSTQNLGRQQQQRKNNNGLKQRRGNQQPRQQQPQKNRQQQQNNRGGSLQFIVVGDAAAAAAPTRQSVGGAARRGHSSDSYLITTTRLSNNESDDATSESATDTTTTTNNNGNDLLMSLTTASASPSPPSSRVSSTSFSSSQRPHSAGLSTTTSSSSASGSRPSSASLSTAIVGEIRRDSSSTSSTPSAVSSATTLPTTINTNRTIVTAPLVYYNTVCLDNRFPYILSTPFDLWFESSPPRGIDPDTFKSTLQVVGTFTTLQAAWNYFVKLADCFDMLPNYTNLRLFRAGIRPMWEDEANRQGGRWSVQISKKDSPVVWQSAIVTLLSNSLNFADDLCGCCINIRSVGDTIQIWNRSSNVAEQNGQVWLTQLTEALALPTRYISKIVYHPHAASVSYNRAFNKRGERKSAAATAKSNVGDSSVNVAADAPGAATTTTTTTTDDDSVDDSSSSSASFGFYDSVEQRRAKQRRNEDIDDISSVESIVGSSSTTASTSSSSTTAVTVNRPPPTLAGRFFGTVHAPATVRKLKTLLLFDAMPVNEPRATTPRGGKGSLNSSSSNESGDAGGGGNATPRGNASLSPLDANKHLSPAAVAIARGIDVSRSSRLARELLPKIRAMLNDNATSLNAMNDDNINNNSRIDDDNVSEPTATQKARQTADGLHVSNSLYVRKPTNTTSLASSTTTTISTSAVLNVTKPISVANALYTKQNNK